MSNDQAPPVEFVALKAQAEALGFVYGMDFVIQSIPAEMSSEVVLFDLTEDGYTVSYQDMGQYTVLSTSPSFPAAKEQFLEELARTAGPRGRGKYAGIEPPNRYAGWTQEQIRRELLGEDGLG